MTIGRWKLICHEWVLNDPAPPPPGNGQLEKPVSLSFDPKGNMLVLDNERIQVTRMVGGKLNQDWFNLILLQF